jgi:hypothetical protein
LISPWFGLLICVERLWVAGFLKDDKLTKIEHNIVEEHIEGRSSLDVRHLV